VGGYLGNKKGPDSAFNGVRDGLLTSIPPPFDDIDDRAEDSLRKKRPRHFMPQERPCSFSVPLEQAIKTTDINENRIQYLQYLGTLVHFMYTLWPKFPGPGNGSSV